MGWHLVGKKVAFAVVKEGCGSYSQFTIAKADECLPLSDSTTFDQGSMSLVNPLTVLAFLDILKEKKEKSVVITAAASALGRIINRLFPKEGIEVINIVRREEQANVLKEEGAKYIVNSSTENFESDLKEMTHKIEAVTCLEAIGGTMPGIVLKNMPKKSVVMLYGCLSHENINNVDIADLLFYSKSITGFMLVNWLEKKSFMKLMSTFYKVRNTI